MKTTTPPEVHNAIDKGAIIVKENPAKGTWDYPSPADKVRDTLKPATDYIRDRLGREVPIHPHDSAANILARVKKDVLEASGIKQDETVSDGKQSKL
ncbi:hypothetical protein [Janthinobacterium sp. BJB304]|uniref:hypothetical protein n=1 Tax=Janthinobacterium sp. BJB304 TaxID=1572871 RepID=UPI001179B0A6|nr:hypothetical protein [Janthinobacterium sp. BJB304]